MTQIGLIHHKTNQPTNQPILAILFNTLVFIGIINLDQSEHGSNDNEWVLHILQNLKTGDSPLDAV